MICAVITALWLFFECIGVKNYPLRGHDPGEAGVFTARKILKTSDLRNGWHLRRGIK